MVVTSSMSHREVWRELHGEENERIYQLTRRVDFEMDMGTATLEQQKHALWRMRNACHRLADPANHDREDLFGEWKMGEAPVHPFFEPRAGKTDADEAETTPDCSASGASSSGSQPPLKKEPTSRSSSPNGRDVENRVGSPTSTEPFDPVEAKKRFERKLARTAGEIA
jgi:hypothetical protein